MLDVIPLPLTDTNDDLRHAIMAVEGFDLALQAILDRATAIEPFASTADYSLLISVHDRVEAIARGTPLVWGRQ